VDLQLFGQLGVGPALTDRPVIVNSQADFDAEIERRRTDPRPGDEQRVIRWGAVKPIEELARQEAANAGGTTLHEWDPFYEFR
jgi:hypothetical protein